MDIGFIKSWNKEIKKMNGGKVGAYCVPNQFLKQAMKNGMQLLIPILKDRFY